MMPGYQDIYSEYSRLSDPAQQEAELQRRIELANPELQRILRGVESRLNRQGMFSASPLARGTTRATGEFAGDISRGYYENLDERRMGLLQIIFQIEQAERARKEQRRSSLWGGIGSLLGTGAGFLFGGPPGAMIGGSLGGSIGQVNAPEFEYEPWRP